MEDHINKSLFKDKKLAKLWAKAELAGFTGEELKALKEEFNHHQDKIDEYYSILGDVETGKKSDVFLSKQYSFSFSIHSVVKENCQFIDAMNNEDMDDFNTIDETLAMETNNINKDYLHKANVLREKHRELRDGYDRLYRLSAKGIDYK